MKSRPGITLGHQREGCSEFPHEGIGLFPRSKMPAPLHLAPMDQIAVIAFGPLARGWQDFLGVSADRHRQLDLMRRETAEAFPIKPS